MCRFRRWLCKNAASAHGPSTEASVTAGNVNARKLRSSFRIAVPSACRAPRRGLAGACGREAETAPPEMRPVRTVTVVKRDTGETVAFTGRIEAENETRLAFRIGGCMIERSANVGDRVEPDQVVARLDPQDELNALRAAQADVGACPRPCPLSLNVSYCSRPINMCWQMCARALERGGQCCSQRQSCKRSSRPIGMLSQPSVI